MNDGVRYEEVILCFHHIPWTPTVVVEIDFRVSYSNNLRSFNFSNRYKHTEMTVPSLPVQRVYPIY